jgi:serine/threonine protein kinase
LFLAERAEGGPRVAVRVLDESRSGPDSPLFERLREHVARVATLNARCAAIGTLQECGRAEGSGIYLAFEHPEGPTLAAVLQREKRLDPERAVRLGLRVAETLESAHMLGTSHGGLRPENIALVGEDESVKLTEFGVGWLRARARGDAEGVADSPYLAPEQWVSGEATPQGDVYAVGAILYEALAGRPPEVQAPARRRASIQPLRKLRPELSRSLERVVRRALEPDLERRYRDMTDFFNDLWSEITPFSGQSPAQQDIIRRGLATGKRTRLVAVGIVLGAIVLIGLLSRLLVSEPPALVSPARPPAPLPQVATPSPSQPTPAPVPPPSASEPTPTPPTPATTAPPPVIASPPTSQPTSPAVPAVPPPVMVSPPIPKPAPAAPPPVIASPPTPERTPPPAPTTPPPVIASPPTPKPAPPRPEPAPQPPRPAQGSVVAPTPPPARAVLEAPRPPARSAPPVTRPPAPREEITPVTRPPGPRPAETPAPTAPARDAGDDGAAIIDWLLKDSSSARR